MANFRQIHVSIWKDSWFLDLEPDEKLLFIYLFSNENTSLSGIYRLARKVIEFETGLDRKRVVEIFKKFEENGKVFVQDDIIWIVNMKRYHATKSSKVLTRIQSDIEMIPPCEIKQKYIEHYNGDIPYPYPIHTQPQLNEYEDLNEYEKEKTTSSGDLENPYDRISSGTLLDNIGWAKICEVYNVLPDMAYTNVSPHQQSQMMALLEKDAEKCVKIAVYYNNMGDTFTRMVGRIINNFDTWKTNGKNKPLKEDVVTIEEIELPGGIRTEAKVVR
jgi:hypothetical protein